MSEEDLCAWEPLAIMSEGDPISISHASLEMTHEDSLKVESTASVISQDEVQHDEARNKSELDCTLYKRDHLFEPLFEDFIYDFEDASEKLMSPLNTLRTSPINKDASFATEWKETSKNLLPQGESAQQCRMLDWRKEGCKVEEDFASQKASWELPTEQAIPSKQLLVDMSYVPTREDMSVTMGESLLDCIVKESPIKEVSSFLTQPTGALFRTNICSSDEDLIIKWDDSDVTEKMSSHEGNTLDTGQQTESTHSFQDTELTISPDPLDENLDYIRTLMQSSRHLKECLRSNLTHCINKKEVVGSISPPEHVELVTKGEHNAEEKPLHSETSFAMAGECRQGDTGDIFTSHNKSSSCLNPSEALLKLREANTSDLCSKQLLLQEGDMDFSRAIKDLEQDQLKQFTHIVDLQSDSLFFEKKIKQKEKLLLQKGDADFNKVIQELEWDQKKQQTQIMDLYYDNVSLKTKIKELELDILEQHNFINVIKDLKRYIADLTEAKNKATEEKEEAERCLKSMQDALARASNHLLDFGAEKSALMLQLEKLDADHNILQEKHKAEVEQKNKYMNQCAELDCMLKRKEQEIQELNHLKKKLEQEVNGTISALHRMNKEKEDTEKHFVSLQEELQRQKDERLAEREKLDYRYNKLIAQVKVLQVECENEQAETEKMQQQICAFKMESSELQQQIAKDKEQNRCLQLESARWKEQYDQIRGSRTVEDHMQYQMIQLLRYKIGSQQEELRKKEEIIEWHMHILGRFFLDMKSMHSDLSTRSFHSEDDHSNSPYVQKASHLLSKVRSLLALTDGLLTCQDTDNQTLAEHYKKNETVIGVKRKMKSLLLKNKRLEKELQKHKEDITAIKKLILHETFSEDHSGEATEVSQEEPDNGTNLLDLLKTKLGEYHKQSDELHGVIKELEHNLVSKEEACKKVTEENDKLQKNLGSLMCKVTSYEEIIECADQKLELANSQISYLEKRNQDLEDRTKNYKMKTRSLRQRCSFLLIQEDFQKLNGNNLVTDGQRTENAQCECEHRSQMCLQMT
ncbi:cancer-associated gene 1 protein [Hemicordylus capensis]|uniref:cancer-associated gene 1 protein n=1 Tax=Hemicordylus capensis TaxID=884348 RepID=UPI0023030E9A|nr:cancer-associated gene 1 protein [Hemicordylus capensis]